MIEHRPFSTLGSANHGWLQAHHHFSFGEYQDNNRMNWGALRVWNDDKIARHQGFPRHGHRDMEIITYVRKGAITHGDHLGNTGRTEAGDVQVMSAGKGILHEEWNREDTETEIFQLWILPQEKGGQPRWDQRSFPKAERQGSLTVLASGFDSDENALRINTKSRVLGATLQKGESINYVIQSNRYGYLVPSTGSIEVNGTIAHARDALAIKDEQTLRIAALEDNTEILLVDTSEI